MNRDYAKDASNNNYFGFDLGYDKAVNGIIGNSSYNQVQYNGNIAGTVWKSKRDGEKRKFDYDNVNRLYQIEIYYRPKTINFILVKCRCIQTN